MATQLIRKGDADAALACADTVVTCVFKTQGVDQRVLDLEAGYAEIDGDVVVIHASGQWVHEEQRLIALALGLPVERVRIVQPPTGGAFGGREDISIQIYLGLAALKLGRPVRMQYTREESMIARHKRHPMEIEYTLGATADGRFTAARVLIRSDEGAYASTGPRGAPQGREPLHRAVPRAQRVVRRRGSIHQQLPAGAMRGLRRLPARHRLRGNRARHGPRARRRSDRPQAHQPPARRGVGDQRAGDPRGERGRVHGRRPQDLQVGTPVVATRPVGTCDEASG